MKQEIFAHFNLIAMTRRFTNFGDAMHNTQSPPDPLPESRANFKAALFALARNLEGLVLRQAVMMRNAVQQVLDSTVSQPQGRANVQTDPILAAPENPSANGTRDETPQPQPERQSNPPSQKEPGRTAIP